MRMKRSAWLISLCFVAGCATSYEPQPYEDTNGDGHVTFHDDNPYASRGFARHMARQQKGYSEEDESND